MGMFDNVICKHPLPDNYTGEVFQTKDLDCGLDTYRITADGRLELQRQEMVPDGPRKPHWFMPEHDYQPMKVAKEWWEPIPHHGDLNFYRLEGDANDPRGPDERWHEYTARFTEGALTRIIVVGAEPADGAVTRPPVIEGESSREASQ